MQVFFEKNKCSKIVINDGLKCSVHCYIHKKSNKLPNIFIIPGGAYGGLCPRENKPIAERFYKSGYNSFYIDYSVGGEIVFPNVVNECISALNYLSFNSEKLNIDENNFFLIGFSAGAHLAGLVDNYKDEFVLKNKIKLKGIIYAYPVVSSDIDLIHERSFTRLLGGNYEKSKNNISIEKLITVESSPSFIFHCVDDREVSYKNSLLLFEAYNKNQVKSELHLFDKGGHGVALPTLECFSKDELPYINQDLIIWFNLCDKWIKRILRSKL